MSEKFLIVDDNDDSAYLTFRHLRAAFPESQVIQTEAGQQALDELHRHRDFSAVITDYRMPKMNGLTLIREIRKFDMHVPIILRTAMEDMEESAIEAGANHVLPWFKWDELGHVLKELLHGAEHR